MDAGKTMYDYHGWAMQALLDHLASLPADVMTKEVKSSYPSITKTISHVHAVDMMWLKVLEGTGLQEALQESMGRLAVTETFSVAEFKHAFDQSTASYRSLIETRSDLDHTIMVDNPWSGSRETSTEEILLHVANHGSYHRGNITTMLRQIDEASIMMDYSLFWYEDVKQESR